ncbi:hypothetical protein AAZV13_19G128900 [Glycine max]
MAFSSFLGRVLFASVFILSAYQEFNAYGVDGGPTAKALRPKFDAFAHQVHSKAGFQLPDIDMKILVAGAIALKGLGGILFILGSSFGAFLLRGQRIYPTFHQIYSEYGSLRGIVVFHWDEKLYS